jgi:hypothetical protein
MVPLVFSLILRSRMWLAAGIFGDNGFVGLLGGGAITAAIGLLWWVLRRTDRALERSSSAVGMGQRAMQFTGNNLLLVEALRQAIFLQGGSLDEWEDWGVEAKRVFRAMQRDLRDHGSLQQEYELPVPPKHLDLSHIFRNIPAAAVEEEPEPAQQNSPDESFFNRFFPSPKD